MAWLNSCKNCWIDMMELYDQLHSISNRSTKHERYYTYDTRGVAFTKNNYIENAWKRESPITPTEIIESKWRDNMINYISWHITLQTWKNEFTEKTRNYMPPYYYMRDIKIHIYTISKKFNVTIYMHISKRPMGYHYLDRINYLPHLGRTN
jgi:hypothetical protein